MTSRTEFLKQQEPQRLSLWTCSGWSTTHLSLLPFVDLLFKSLCTERFHLEVHAAGLKTQRSETADARAQTETDKLRDVNVFTFPVSSGPGCRVTEHGRFRGIWQHMQEQIITNQVTVLETWQPVLAQDVS